MKKVFKILVCFVLTLCLFGCGEKKVSEDIIILYTSDIHGAVTDNIGFDGLVAYKNNAMEKSQYVTLVDVGDMTQGTALTSISQGEAILECADLAGYDILTIGNHEFDYGIDRLNEIISANKSKYINSNIVYTGNKSDNVINSLDKYKIVEYGNTKVAYISLLTPQTFISESPSVFKENNEVVIDFFGGLDSEDFYTNVQSLVDECRNNGADYVVVLSHLGSVEASEPYTSSTLAKSTKGIDIIIDSHSHINFSCKSLLNSENNEVLVTATGNNFNSIGQVVITPSGLITTSNITDYEKKDNDVTTKLNEIVDEYTGEINRKLFVNNTALSIYDENGIRVVRNKEMPIGNFIADAYRYVTEADVAFVNGGGVRADLPSGDISFTSFLNVNPFGNIMCAIELTGQELVDYLEYCYRYTKADYLTKGVNNCEYGSFMQVSGMKFTIDSSVTSDVVTDGNDNFIEAGNKRRLKDVMILGDNNEYEPIDLEKTYIVGSIDYILFEGGAGTESYLKDKNVVLYDAGTDYDALYTYARDALDFDLSIYSTTDNRITVK